MAEAPETTETVPEDGAATTSPAEAPAATGEAASETTEQALTVEDLASDLGWRPETEWKGAKDKWEPAADFLRAKVEKSARLSSEIRDVKSTVDRISRTTAAITDRAVREEGERLSRLFEEATAAGDAQAAWEAAQAIHRHAAPNDEAEQLREWQEKNPWFDADPEARAYVVGLGEIHKGKPFAETARIVEAAVRKRFPEHFDAETRTDRRPAPLVNAPQSRTGRASARPKSEGDLPPEARRAGEDFVRRGRVNSLADYAKIYFEENAG